MDAIAAASGITKALLYQYFGSKRRLYEACIERARRAMFDPITLQVAGHALVGCGEQVGRWWLEHPDVPRAAVVDRFLAVAQGAIAAVQRAHGIAPS